MVSESVSEGHVSGEYGESSLRILLEAMGISGTRRGIEGDVSMVRIMERWNPAEYV